MASPDDPAPAAGTDAPPLAIVDIDGVLADVRHRLHHLQSRPKRWGAFFAAAVRDEPHQEGLALVEVLLRDHEVVFLTGRPEHLREDTREWLARHGLDGHRLVMRPEGERGPAAALKVRLLAALAAEREVGLVVDDDPMVIAAMEDAGHPTMLAGWEPRGAAGDATLRRAQEVEGRT